ncbi:ribonuclease E inhibitor RraB [Burkholderia sp. Bp8984]|uniref:ribonuclease E inhibitor RraB n=1 Tax=Burkholderia sp. Bp8984 TaxID=2184549 RepID=UPI000F59372F|nr:ribonuclease E inhibitor RraB [Burkholderia sp. Bp8984]RQS53484.1 ribonuclease E inhibitor RraB [Burkholderia sp. Bp8984]
MQIDSKHSIMVVIENIQRYKKEGKAVSVIETLMETAVADVDQLRVMDTQGDDFGVPREVDFCLIAPSAEKASIVSGFINDYQYGRASVEQVDDHFRVLVFINMPVLQHNILAVSGFMTCISAFFGLTYDGWGCVVQKRN